MAGGGIGEAALIGAAFGGGTALATGQDPLKGALMGAVSGGAMNGVGSAIGAMGKTASDVANVANAGSSALSGGAGAIQNGVIQGANTGLNVAGTFNPALSSATASTVAPTVAPGLTGFGGMQNVASTQGAGINAVGSAPTAVTEVPSVASAVDPTAQAAQSTAQTFDNSAKNIFGDAGFDVRNYTSPDTALAKGADWWEKQGLGGQMMYSGLGGAGYGAYKQSTMTPEQLEEEDDNPFGFANFDPMKFTASEPKRPDPYYTGQYENYKNAAQGGVMQSYADGGIAALAPGMGGNLNFPQGRLDQTQYATPTQMPTSAEVVNADYAMKTDPFTGNPIRMAEGGNINDEIDAYLNTVPSVTRSTADNGIDNLAFTRSRNKKKDYTSSGYGQDLMARQQAADREARAAYNKQYNQLNGFGGGINNSGFNMGNLPTNKYGMSAGKIPAFVPPVVKGPDYSVAAPQANTNVFRPQYAEGGVAGYNLGGYASGGNPRLLKGPGDGMSDNIPATIGDRQPARLADGEFVVPADVVSHLGNGSTDAGAKHLYTMMDRVRKARTGNKKQGKQIKPAKFLPA